MNLKQRETKARRRASSDSACPTPASAPRSESPDVGGGAGLLVHHGIHQDHYPIAGMTVAQARATLSPLMNVDPEAVAVIAGEVVEDESTRVLQETDQMLSFVKKSSVKGH